MSRCPGRRWHGRTSWLGWLGCLWLAPVWAAPPSVAVRAGFAGLAAAGQPLPVRIEVTAADEPAQGVVEVPVTESGSREPLEIHRVEVDVPAGGSKVYWLALQPRELASELEATYINRQGQRQAQTAKIEMLASDMRLLAVVSPDRAGLRYLKRASREYQVALPGGGQNTEVIPGLAVTNLPASDLPPTVTGLSGLLAVVLSGAEITGTPAETRQALADWVRWGGHLIMVGGSASVGLFADEVLGPLCPVTASGTVPVPGSAFAPLGAAYGEPLLAGDEQYGLTGSTIRPHGRVLHAVAGLPLVAQAPHGQGRVTFIAAAYDQPPLDDWRGQKALWHKLLDAPSRAGHRPYAAWRALRELAGRSSAVQTPAVAVVVAFLVAYLLALMPLQSLVLRRLNRRELVWVVSPVIIIGFAMLAYFMGVALRGRRPAMRTVSLVEHGAPGEPVDITSVCALHSPGRRRYELAAPPATRWVNQIAEGGGVTMMSDSDDRLLRTGRRLEVHHEGQAVRPVIDLQMWEVAAFGLVWSSGAEGQVAAQATFAQQRWGLSVTSSTKRLWRHAVAVLDGRAYTVGDIDTAQPFTKDLGPALVGQAGKLPKQLVSKLAEHQRRGFAKAPTQAALSLLLAAAATPPHGRPDPVLRRPLGSPSLWAWVELPGGPLTVVHQGAEARQLQLIRVPITIR